MGVPEQGDLETPLPSIQSISQSIALMPCCLRERPPRGWPRQTDLHLSLSMHSLLAHSKPFPLTPLSFLFFLPTVTPSLFVSLLPFIYVLFTYYLLNPLNPLSSFSQAVFPLYTLHHLPLIEIEDREEGTGIVKEK